VSLGKWCGAAAAAAMVAWGMAGVDPWMVPIAYLLTIAICYSLGRWAEEPTR
jgi:hypothetical protein